MQLPLLRSTNRTHRWMAVGLVIVALAATGCGDDSTKNSSGPTTGVEQSTTTPSTTIPDPAYRRYIATVRPELGNIKVLDEPAGVPLQLDTKGRGALVEVKIDNPLPSGAPATLLVKKLNVEAVGSMWHEVYLPVRPNGSTGWIAASDVELSTTDMAATVSLAGHRLELRNEDKVIASYPVAIGTPENPTPTGLFFVKELVEPTNPEGSYGPIAFGLSAFSPTLVDTEAFADGVIGIHGTNKPELIGTAVSHGCVRMNNEDILDLESKAIPLGMPVTIID